jgi:hypothetical protein
MAIFNGSAPRPVPGRRTSIISVIAVWKAKGGTLRRVKYWGCVSAVDSNICEGEVTTIAGLLR